MEDGKHEIEKNDESIANKEDIIVRSKGSATLELFEEAHKKENLSMKDLKIKAVIGDNEIIKRMVLKGIGISVMSRLSIDKEVRENLILPVKIKGTTLTRGIYYIYQKNRYFSTVDERFKEFILEKTKGDLQRDQNQ